MKILFMSFITASGKIHLTPAKVKGKYVIRFVANQENTCESQINNAWELIQTFATDILAELTPQKKRPSRPALKKLDRTHSQRFSFTRNVSQEIYERQSSIQKLMDGATPIVVIDTDDILLSLQRATQKNKEAAALECEKSKDRSQVARSHTNGSV